MKASVILNEIVSKYKKNIMYTIGKYFPNQMDRDDAFQDAMLHVFEQISKTPVSDLSKWNSEGWIKTVVKNYCITILRRVKVLQKNDKPMVDDNQLEREIDASSWSEHPEIPASRSIKSIEIREILSVLNAREKQLIILRFFKNYSISDIDKILNIRNSAVYIGRALDKIKREFGADRIFEYFDNVELD